MQVVLWAVYCDESIIDRNGFVLGLGFMGLVTMIEKGNFYRARRWYVSRMLPNGDLLRAASLGHCVPTTHWCVAYTCCGDGPALIG